MEYKWIAQDKFGCIAKYYSKPKNDRVEFYESDSDVIQKSTGMEIKNWECSLINLETHDYKIEDGILVKVEKTQRCKYADVFIEAANDKTKVLQVKKLGTWFDVDVNNYEYRIKPENKPIRVRFRIYLNHDNEPCIWQGEGEPTDLKAWIDNGCWQEVQV